MPQLSGFILLYSVMYAGFGAASPFLPSLIESRGISPEHIGILFAAGTAIRLLSAPVAGRLADHWQAHRLVLAVCATAAAAAAPSYLLADVFLAFLAISLLHAMALAPTTSIADALALAASGRKGGKGFEYGWVRGAGSAAFIAGLALAGLAVSMHGPSAIVWLQALLMLAVPFALFMVPPVTEGSGYHGAAVSRVNIFALAHIRAFRNVMLVAALVLGSHAMHDTFAVIRWRRAGIEPHTASLLWAMSVGAEVVVFFLLGPFLIRALSPAGAIALAACAGALRWGIMAFTAVPIALFCIQPLHGLTFALLHLACMRLIADNVPPQLAATAQAFYGTVAVGSATSLLTLASGWLYGSMGASGFLIMSVLCLLALPIAANLRKSG